MPLIALASLKASPGVTTTCLALAAAWPAPRRLLIEADPAGGDLGPWLGLPPAPGLAGLAAAGRHDRGRGLAWRHARELAGGLHLVIAPAGAEQAAACLAALTGDAATVIAALAAGPDPVIADCGRLDPASPALAIATRASLTLLMVRPQVSDLSRVALRAGALTSAGARLALLLAPEASSGPAGATYPAAEIASTLEIPVLAAIPADPRGTAALIALVSDDGDPRKIRKLPLARAAAGLAAALTARQPAASAPAPPGLAPALAHHHAEVNASDATG